MAGAIQPASARAGVTFEVERAEANGDELVACGRWSAVRGMRFMRPTLVVDGRALLATLEHKPGGAGHRPVGRRVPVAGRQGRPRGDGARRRTVGDGPRGPRRRALAGGPRPWRPARRASPGPRPSPRIPTRIHVERLETEIGFLRDQAARGHRGTRRPARRGPRRRRARKDAATARGPQLPSRRSRDELSDARTAAERERDRVATQRDEAVRDLDAAVRTRQRMEAQRDEAVQAMESVRAESTRRAPSARRRSPGATTSCSRTSHCSATRRPPSPTRTASASSATMACRRRTRSARTSPSASGRSRQHAPLLPTWTAPGARRAETSPRRTSGRSASFRIDRRGAASSRCWR